MTATNQTNSSIILDVNMFQFINEFIADARPGSSYNEFSYNLFIDFVHDNHSECIEIKNGCTNTLENYNCMMDFFTEYGLLRYAYETKVELKITETGQDRTGNCSCWCYTVQLSENRLPVEIQFYTRWRITDFQDYEDEQNAAFVDEIRELFDKKPVLCLESEQQLFKRAGWEIAKAIQSGYYRDITDFEYPNYLEVMGWMGYSNQFSTGNRSMSMAEKAVDRAFGWFRDGINAGLIYDNIKK